MKKNYYYTVLTLCVVLSMGAVSAATETLDLNNENSKKANKISSNPSDLVDSLTIGDKSKKVVSLQKILSKHGYYTRKIDGVFGPYTEQAVKDLQTYVGIKADGIVGEITRSVLRDLDDSSEKSSYNGNSYSAYRSSIYGGHGKGVGDCWDNSEMLYNELKAQGKKVRIIQYPTSLSPRHRSVQEFHNGKWIDYDYKGNGYKKVYYATKNKNGAIVIKQ